MREQDIPQPVLERPEVRSSLNSLSSSFKNLAILAYNAREFTPEQLADAHFLKEETAIVAVAIHEIGHDIALSGVGRRKSISVVPDGQSLGRIHYALHDDYRHQEFWINRIKVAHGSRIAEDYFDLSHGGCAGDEGSSWQAANVLAYGFHQGRKSAEDFMSSGRSKSRVSFWGVTPRMILEKAFELRRKRTM